MKKLIRLFIFTLAPGMISISLYGQNDIGVTGATAPVSGCNLPCISPTITVYNYGPTIFVGNYEFCYQVNGGPVVCEPLSIPSFNSGAVYTYTFVQPVCFPTQGTYNFTFYTNILPPTTSDVNTANDVFNLSIVNDTTVVPGTLVLSDSVCAGINSGVLTQSGNTGYLDWWEMSTDGGGSWNNIGNVGNATYAYSNVPVTTIYRVKIDGGYCPDGWSQWVTITAVPPPVGGTAVGGTTVCQTGNTGQISVSGQSGTIIGWNQSTDNGVTWSPVGTTSNPMTYNNLTQTTLFIAVISNGGYCPDEYSSATTVTVAPPTVPGQVVSDATVCAGNNSDSVALIGNVGNVLFWLFSVDSGATWSPIGNTTTLQGYSNLTTTTLYAAVVVNGICPQDTSTFATITVQPAPAVFAGTDTTINQGDVYCMNATGGIIYTWSPATYLDNPGLPNPCMTAVDIGTFTYTVTAQDVWGCTNSDQIVITVLDTTTIFPPVVANFITPNGDGLNDVWNVMNIGFYPDNEVMVYNNHGQEVYRKTGYTNDWDGTYNGTPLPDGSYYYVVKINALDRTLKGVVTITDTH
jgi:gliding motility-associated-like protein